MSKLFIFAGLWWLLGSPLLALLVMLLVLYLLDRAFIGLFPSLMKPFQRLRRMGALKQELRMQPHNVKAKHELARLYMERGKYSAALPLLLEAVKVLEDSAEVHAEIGFCMLKLSQRAEGEQKVLESLQLNPRVKFGEPYLRLGEAYAKVDGIKAASYLQQFSEVHSSSSEAYYRLGNIYRQLGRIEDAKRAYREAVLVYRSLPKYKRKTERRYALLSWFRR